MKSMKAFWGVAAAVIALFTAAVAFGYCTPKKQIKLSDAEWPMWTDTDPAAADGIVRTFAQTIDRQAVSIQFACSGKPLPDFLVFTIPCYIVEDQTVPAGIHIYGYVVSNIANKELARSLWQIETVQTDGILRFIGGRPEISVRTADFSADLCRPAAKHDLSYINGSLRVSYALKIVHRPGYTVDVQYNEAKGG